MSSTTINTPYTIAVISNVYWQKVADLLAVWKVERDMKCPNCAKGLGLGRHGCHFEDDGEESYAVGNCKAWPLSRRIQQLEEAMRP